VKYEEPKKPALFFFFLDLENDDDEKFLGKRDRLVRHQLIGTQRGFNFRLIIIKPSSLPVASKLQVVNLDMSDFSL
jgi:hypothetical protein